MYHPPEVVASITVLVSVWHVGMYWWDYYQWHLHPALCDRPPIPFIPIVFGILAVLYLWSRG